MTEVECDMMLTLQWPAVVRWAKRQDDEWLKGFVMSIAGKGKRKKWLPSPKQERLMRRLIAEQRADDQALLDGESALIERD
jgi:hypothetical protein